MAISFFRIYLKGMKTLQQYILKNPELSIVIIAIILRGLTFTFYPETTIFNDSEDYRNLALRLASLNLEDYGGFRTPGYSLLILLAFHNVIVLSIIQHVLGILTSLFIYTLVRKTTSRKSAAIISAVVFSTFLHVIFFEKGVLTETLTTFLFIWFLYQLNKSVLLRSFKPHQFGLLSLILLLLIMTKPFFIYLLPLIAVFLFVLLYKKAFFAKAKPILIITLPSLLFYLGWSQLNKENTGVFTITTYFGINLAQEIVGFAEKAPDDYATIRDLYVEQIKTSEKEVGYTYYAIWDVHEEMMRETGQSFPELSKELAAMSKETIINNPYDYMKQIGVSWVRFWDAKIYWDVSRFTNDTVRFLYKGIWKAQHILVVVGKYTFVLVFLLSLIWVIMRRNLPVNLLTFIFAVVMCGALLQAMVNYSENFRFSFPFLPAIIVVLASYCVKLPVFISKK